MKLSLDPNASWIGRVWKPDTGPCICTLRGGDIVDITAKEAPSVRDVLEREDAVDYVRNVKGEVLLSLAELSENSLRQKGIYFLAPCDFQAVKACGVTFARSMVERVIEERAGGSAKKADAIRGRLQKTIGKNLHNIVPGSEQAQEIKKELIREGMWSQYLEVGIGPDAEIFSKAQPLSSVGFGSDIGLHPISKWNNPEPEIVLAVSSKGRIMGATLGNDVNLRDVEGRSALLLPKAKDNNASSAIGPMLRLLDDGYSMEDICADTLTMRVEGEDGFVLDGESSMEELSRHPQELVDQTLGAHHQYPDGFMLYLGTLFAPTKDRNAKGEGFTHKIGDVVSIASPKLGVLQNRVRLSTDCPPWEFGASQFARNLVKRGLLSG
ncbi:MAG: fumarylacetoacetate hydrolase family protein [Parvibaculales bacterium]